VEIGIKRRQYTKEQKEEIAQKALSGKSTLQLGKEHNLSPRTYQLQDMIVVKWRAKR